MVTAALLCAVPPAAAQGAPPRIILFIGDGVGLSYWTAALFAAESLAVQQFPVVGLVDPRSADSKVTDSAAGATAYASGKRTDNLAVGVGPDSQPLETVLERASRRGMATGLVATSRVTHATPAAFVAHVPNREMEWEIGKQLLEHRVTVVEGGGRAIFEPARRADSLDLLSQIVQHYTYVETADQLRALNLDTVKTLFGMFALSHMPPAVSPEIVSASARKETATGVAALDTVWVPSRSPTLPEMTAAALGVLDHNPRGFFLMVEGSQPDWRGHANEPLPTIEGEMLDFDAAIRVGLDYRRKHPETLIVVVADHETGGLALQGDTTTAAVGEGELYHYPRVVARYTTIEHTATMVPLFAIGPGAEQFGGILPNWRVGQLLLERVKE